MDLAALSNTLGVQVNAELLQQALVHRSYSYEHGGIPNNERLEFLGDSVLGFVVTEHLFKTQPDLSEGELTKLKNSVVSEKALAHVAREIGLGEYLLLGRGEEQTGGRNKASLLADAFEAILGATLESIGFEASRGLVEKFIFPLLADPDALRQQSDPKTRILEVALAQKLGAVKYEITHEGPDHERVFTATLLIDGKASAVAVGKTKKAAETEAAALALAAIEKPAPSAAARTAKK
jgi:ribonuclease-3